VADIACSVAIRGVQFSIYATRCLCLALCFVCFFSKSI